MRRSSPPRPAAGPLRLVLAVALFSAALAAGLVPARAVAQTVQITGSIVANTTWGPTGTVVGDVFWIRNSIAINGGVTLTIQPGVVVKFDPGRTLTVNGTLSALGTAGQNIFFTSIRDDAVGGDTNGDGNATLPAASDWGTIQFTDASPDNSVLDHCDVRYAGSSQQGALTFVNSSHSVANSVIRRSYYGLDCQGTAAPILTNTSIEASTLTPIVLDFTATPVLSSLVFSSSNNGYDAFGLRGGTLLSGSAATLPQRGATVGVNPIANVTYVLLGSLTINAGASLTVNPGVVIKPSSSHSIVVNGNLTMNGGAAAGDTITITSIHDDNFGRPGDTNNNGSITAPNRGDWGRITFAQGATGSLARCRIKFGTTSGNLGMVEMTNNSIPISDCLLSDAGHGLSLFGTSAPAVANVDINNCSSTPILLSVSANPVFGTVNFLANAITAVGLHGESVAVDSRIPVRTLGGFANITYYVMNGSIRMLSPAILRIDPGVVIKNQLNGGGFVIDGGLVADAKPESLIVFTSERDDQYGNPPDTNGDGATTTPASGNWSYLHFTGTADDPSCVLDWCRVTYASYGPFDSWNCNLRITNAAPSLTRTVFSVGQYGVRIEGNSTPLIQTCEFNNLSAAPIVMSAQSDPTIATDCTYSTNTYNAIALLAETLSQDALIRYRPGVGTPTFAYLPTGTITVASGVTLAIEPRVVLKPSSSFAVFNVNGALNVVGSDGGTGRIVFTSRRDDNPIYGGDTTPTDASTPQAGDWGYLQFNDTAVDAACVLRNVLFQFGGTNSGVISTTSASPRLVRLEFFQNGTAMEFAGNSQPVVDTTNVLNCTGLPIKFSLVSDPQFPNPNQVVLANNTFTAFGLLGETVAQDVRTRVRALSGFDNMTYCPTSTITIAFGAKWRIDPGVVLKLGRIFIDPIGTVINIDGALIADGKPDSLIVFTSAADDAFGLDVRSDGAATTPAPGQWHGVNFSGISNDTSTVIDHCRFRYGGYGGTGALSFTNAGQTVTNTIVTQCSGAGIQIAGNSTPKFIQCQVDSSTNVPVLMSLVSEPEFTNVQFLGNAYTALGVISESIAQDVLWKIRPVAGRNNMPFLLQGQLTIGLGATLTMQPGVIVKSNGSGSIVIQRAFLAEGRSVEPESLIVFTSYRDDFYGGDTNNDGIATAPAAGDWNYITVEGTAIDPQVRLKNCVLRYGGAGSTTGVLRCVNSAPTVDSCLIAYNVVGISVEGASNPRVHECSLYGNTQHAINNTGGSFCVDADSCWWGAASGPNDNSSTADLCGLGLNAGAGDRVSNNVDYTPFNTSGIANPLLGDVSLNGQVLAYDASLVMQSLVALITLSPLQEQVADVDGDDLVTAFDAALILQYVARIIPSFPAVHNRAQQARGPLTALPGRSAGDRYDLRLGAPRRDGDGWLVPVLASGSAAVLGVELRLEGSGAGDLAGVVVADAGRALHEHHVADGVARVAVAAAAALGEEVATLRFASAADDWTPPRLAWARVNAVEVALGPAAPPAAAPAVSFLAPAAPNPATTAVTVRLGLARAEAGRAAVRVLDVSGRVVGVLHDGPLAAGEHVLEWNLAGAGGRRVPPGLYFLDARAGAFRATRRLTVVR